MEYIMIAILVLVIGIREFSAAEERKAWAAERDKLTDKIMAKNYGEYLLGQEAKPAKTVARAIAPEDEAKSKMLLDEHIGEM